MSEPIIKVENVSKKYELGLIGAGTLYHTMWNFLEKIKGGNARDLAAEKEFWALRDINFEVNQGEVIGIIGRNGAGKSTLLKVLSRITEPTTGRITVNGRIASLLEVGTGFHPELSGRENIFLNGSILGMGRREINSKFDEIVEFSGVGKFLDTPVKRYSSGMYVRLAFAVAAHLEPEILVIDEVLSVGDAEFQKKCIGKMGEVAKSGRTVLFVSHNMGAVKNLCQKGIVLSSGKVEMIGSVDEALEAYMKKANDINLNEIDLDVLEKNKSNIKVENIEVLSDKSDLTIRITGNAKEHYAKLGIGIKIKTLNDELVSTVAPGLTGFALSNVEGAFKCEYSFNDLGNKLSGGEYYLDVWMAIPRLERLAYFTNIIKFKIEDKDIFKTGVLHNRFKYGPLILQPNFRKL